MKGLLLIVLIVVASINCFSQISFKTGYLGNSIYWREIDDDHREQVDNCEGSAIVYQGDAKIPLSRKFNADSMLNVWAIVGGGAYAKLNNIDFEDDMVSEILNLYIGVANFRPISEKWSVLSSIGVGVFTPFTELSKIRYEHILGNIGVIFIKHFNSNIDLGGGLAINSTFGFPMVFPSMYFNWSYDGNFDVSVSILSGLEVKAGYKINKHLNLNVLSEVNGQMALLEKDGKDVIFTNQYIVAGFSPEIIIGNHITITPMAGINAVRPVYYNDRTLRGVFKDDTFYYFGTSPYASMSIVIK